MNTKLLLCFVLVSVLAGCGGGGTDPTASPVLATDKSATSGGSDQVGISVLVGPLVGPTVNAKSATNAKVCISGQWTQKVYFGSTLEWVVEFAGQPTQMSPQLVDATTSVVLPLTYCQMLPLAAGDNALSAKVTVRALDAQGLPTSALASYTAAADWMVTAN